MLKYSGAINGHSDKMVNKIRHRARDTWESPPGVGKTPATLWAGPLREVMDIVDPRQPMSEQDELQQVKAHEMAEELVSAPKYHT